MKERILSGKNATGPVEAFKEHGADFIVADTLTDLVSGMNGIAKDAHIDERTCASRSKPAMPKSTTLSQKIPKSPPFKPPPLSRRRLIRTAKPHRFLDPDNGPLIAVRLNLITRKTLGGLNRFNSQAINAEGNAIPGLYAVGEAAGFGGGGYHGYNSLGAHSWAAASFRAAPQARAVRHKANFCAAQIEDLF